MGFPWFGRAEKEKVYETLREGLDGLGAPHIKPELGFAPLAIGYVDGGARFVRHDGRMEIICHVTVGVSADVKISDPYSEIRRKGDNLNYKAKTKFRRPKKIRLEKTVGYLNGEATVEEVQPLVDALVNRYFLQEMKAIATKNPGAFIPKSEELAELDREIAGYTKFEPI
ncbi:MAG: hypothetical protein HY516_05190 [Candidatus Aenigmarchaeota archaeon]|nr:hypothetical protein [Candidatus Aenigmarchaeota archaeon]